MAEDCCFEVGELNIAAQRWGSPQGYPVMALHGWLDNSGSFDFLAPLLQGVDCLAVDLAGHGLSDHRVHLGAYNIWQDVGDIFAIADELGWEHFALIGHSRGAMIAMLAAGTFPERITHLGLIDALQPFINTAEQAPEQLAKSIVELKQQVCRESASHPTLESAIQARQNGFVGVSSIDAEVLARRGVRQSESGYEWQHDNKLLAPSEWRMTEEQVAAFMERITAEVKLIVSSDGYLQQQDSLASWLANFPQLKPVYLSGDHYIHMHSEVANVAREFNELLQQ